MYGQRPAWTLLLLSGSLLTAVSLQAQQRPDDSRFIPVVVVERGELDEPMVFEVLRDGTVYIIERKGALKRYDPATGATVVVDEFQVNRTYINAGGVPREAEEGLVGFTLDPNYEENHWAYFLYAHPTIAKHVLTRMELRGSSLLRNTEVTVLEYDVQRETCCHTGGGMTWDADGNLYLTIGNNTGNVNTVQTDQRPGRMNWDDQRGSSNTNDLRGSIIRIRPQPDGSYTVPEGNLFPPGTPDTRPEIYAMGTRNAWRVSRDTQTGYLYWGDVGPDAPAATERTIEGYDEFNQARGPGFFGWPYFVGPNRAYPIIDYETDRILPPKDPARPINDSRWNSGLRELPPAQPSFVWYRYDFTEEFPELGSGGRCAIGGPIYRRADNPGAVRPWPEFFEGKWLAADCVRNWIMLIAMDENGDYLSTEQFLPSYIPIEPIDVKFGPDGDLYVLEYGSIWFDKSPDSRLVRIEYREGNRPPEVRITANTLGGPVPLALELSSEGTVDADGGALSYEWRVAPASGGEARIFTTPDARLSLEQPGAYTVTLTARDAAGASASESVRVVAGNEPPRVAVEIAGNRSFFFTGQPVEFAIQVSDQEDRSIASERIELSVGYVPERFDPLVPEPEIPAWQVSGQPPIRASYVAEIPEGDTGRGFVKVRAAYTDGGAGGLPAQRTEEEVALRNSVVATGTADFASGVSHRYQRNLYLAGIAPSAGGYIGWRELDLSGIARVDLPAQLVAREQQPGGTIEVRLGSPEGQLVGAVRIAPQATAGGGAPPPQVDLRGVSGSHDLYLIFRNDQARPLEPLFNLMSIQFHRE